MLGGAAPVNPWSRSVRDGTVCFSWYHIDSAPAPASAGGLDFFLVFNGGSMVLFAFRGSAFRRLFPLCPAVGLAVPLRSGVLYVSSSRA